MKTVVLNNVLSEKELFYMYNQVINSPSWSMNGESGESRGFMEAPLLMVREFKSSIINYPLCLWGQTVVYRIEKLLESKNIGIPITMERMWFNTTYHGRKTQHWLHQDDKENFKLKSILLFMTPVWQPDWRGSFYVDGEEYNFKPGSAVIFDSKEFHTGTSPIKNTHGWIRLSCNIVLKQNKKTFGISR